MGFRNFVVTTVLTFTFSYSGWAADVQNLVDEAEKTFYALENSNRFTQLDANLKAIEKADPKNPYLWWARARAAFFQKEDLLLSKEDPDKLADQRLKMADQCHDDSDKCIELAPKNAECHMLKGCCYAMQASVWGVSYNSLKVAHLIDQEWEMATKLPSKFMHMKDVTTKDLAQILRGILYRAMPDSWWFRFLAGVKGDKEKAYHWMKESVHGPLQKDTMLVLELAVTSLCYGKSENNPEAMAEGTQWLKEGLKLPSRYPLSELDKSRMKYLLEKPDEACNYRREKFENLSDAAFAEKLK